MEALRLPADAARLWKPTGKAVADTLEKYKCTVRIGGGSILTARFNRHRRSFDIDLKISTHEAHRLMRAAENPEIRQIIERQGAVSTTDTTENGAIWQIEFPKMGLGSQMPRIQTWSNTPEPKHGENWGTVDGDRIRIQSNSQILYGKLKRAGRLAARDLVDIKTAARLDPDNLEIAVNAFGRARLNKAATGWRDEATLIATRAHHQVDGASADERRTWDQLGQHAAEACENATYDRVTLEIRPDSLKFNYRTRGGRTGVREIARKTATNDLQKTGLMEWLEEQGHDPDEISHWTHGAGGRTQATRYLGPMEPPENGFLNGSRKTNGPPEPTGTGRNPGEARGTSEGPGTERSGDKDR